jgi:hypothetical protein
MLLCELRRSVAVEDRSRGVKVNVHSDHDRVSAVGVTTEVARLTASGLRALTKSGYSKTENVAHDLEVAFSSSVFSNLAARSSINLGLPSL